MAYYNNYDDWNARNSELEGEGYTKMGGADNGKCTIWKKFDDDGNELDSEKVCIDADTDSAAGNNNGMPGGGGGPASSNDNPNNYGTQNFDPFKGPYSQPNVAPPTEPTPQGFYNPVTSKAAALGGGPDAAPSFTRPDQPGRRPGGLSAPAAQDGDLGEDNACYYIIFDCGSASPGPKLEGKLRFYDSKGGEEVASFDAVAGNDDPVHYAPPYGTKFTLTRFHSPSIGNTLIFGLGETISFRADLDPERLTDPVSGNETGPFFIFPLSRDSTGTKGAIGIKGQYNELKKAQEMLKAACKCHATLKIGLTDALPGYAPPPPPPDAKIDKPIVNVVNKLPALGIPEFGPPINPVINKSRVIGKTYVLPPERRVAQFQSKKDIKDPRDIVDECEVYRKIINDFQKGKYTAIQFLIKEISNQVINEIAHNEDPVKKIAGRTVVYAYGAEGRQIDIYEYSRTHSDLSGITGLSITVYLNSSDSYEQELEARNHELTVHAVKFASTILRHFGEPGWAAKAAKDILDNERELNHHKDLYDPKSLYNTLNECILKSLKKTDDFNDVSRNQPYDDVERSRPDSRREIEAYHPNNSGFNHYIMHLVAILDEAISKTSDETEKKIILQWKQSVYSRLIRLVR